MTLFRDGHHVSSGNIGELPVISVPGNDFSDTLNWLKSERDSIRGLVRRRGHVMLRDTLMSRVEDFSAIRDQLVETTAPYQEKATPRSRYGNDVYSSTDLPPSQEIRQHNENSYTLDFPGLLIFGCLTAPPVGGATPVADCRQVLAELPHDIAEKGRRLGWILERNFHEGMGLPWQDTFGTADPDEVDEYCRARLIGVSWHDGAPRTRQLRPAVVVHPQTRAEVWFNHAAFWSTWSLQPKDREILEEAYGDAMPFATFWGDGSPITEKEAAEMNAAYDRATRREPWRVGDVLIVDNILSTHGRDRYVGEREIVVAMGELVPLESCTPTVAPAAAD